MVYPFRALSQYIIISKPGCKGDDSSDASSKAFWVAGLGLHYPDASSRKLRVKIRGQISWSRVRYLGLVGKFEWTL